MTGYKKSTLERQSLSEIKMGRGTAICKKTVSKTANVGFLRTSVKLPYMPQEYTDYMTKCRRYEPPAVNLILHAYQSLIDPVRV